MGRGYLTSKRIVKDKKKKYQKGQVQERFAMVKYMGIVENHYLGIEYQGQEYLLIGYYMFQEEADSAVTFEVLLENKKIGEVDYDYIKGEANESELSFLLEELDNKAFFNSVVRFRGEWLYNNFKFFKMKKGK